MSLVLNNLNPLLDTSLCLDVVVPLKRISKNSLSLKHQIGLKLSIDSYLVT